MEKGLAGFRGAFLLSGCAVEDHQGLRGVAAQLVGVTRDLLQAFFQGDQLTATPSLVLTRQSLRSRMPTRVTPAAAAAAGTRAPDQGEGAGPHAGGDAGTSRVHAKAGLEQCPAGIPRGIVGCCQLSGATYEYSAGFRISCQELLFAWLPSNNQQGNLRL
jgi:hypothetical protein